MNLMIDKIYFFSWCNDAARSAAMFAEAEIPGMIRIRLARGNPDPDPQEIKTRSVPKENPDPDPQEKNIYPNPQ